MNNWTERFAVQLLKDNGHLESFLVDLAGFSESRDVAKRLREHGCGVTIDSFKSRLTITPLVRAVV